MFMSLLRTLAHLLLALALIANVGMPSVASAMDHGTHAAAEPAAAAEHASAACHQDAEASAPAPAPLDCCDGGTCACSCLHHAPVVVLSPMAFLVPAHGWVAQLGRLTSVPAAPSAPAIRPPIA